MPAPAVIPAPRAYINAVAVKGFVVELRMFGFMLVQSALASCKVVAPTPSSVNAQKQIPRDSASYQHLSRTMHAVWWDARDFYCD